MPRANYPSGFMNGLTVRNVPILQAQPGNVWWVGNSTTLLPGAIGASNGNPGTFLKPFSTIDYAVGRCQANTGDIIMVRPGHAETISSAAILVLDKAGIAIVGLGSGANRPTLTFTTATTANIPITAANMSIQNFLFRFNFADVASCFTATSTNTPTDFAVENCEFRDLSSALNCLTIVTGNATANSMDGLYFAGNRVSSLGTTAATTAIIVASATNRMRISNNFTVHAILNDTAALLAIGANACLSLQIDGNIGFRPNTSSTGGSFVSGSGVCTGIAHDNRFWQLDATAGIWIATGTALGFFENYSPITGAADRSGLINPVAV